ncbi:hypothetical protein EV193_104410 [Herbihabitans rhizosphaerae]|uniref:Uncharacterized protein n=1 Tax=Herbihabitans rhizosphaerae TaxID=1872711 RepID=A0A4Q7KRN9_9PSEU|nr:hypothetical protein [Herbihabitans rhizosphaerae]RZS39194.1 hypothetical protein EV193_104410 [Herbihabitans rhizosphaerae]
MDIDWSQVRYECWKTVEYLGNVLIIGLMMMLALVCSLDLPEQSGAPFECDTTSMFTPDVPLDTAQVETGPVECDEDGSCTDGLRTWEVWSR